MSDKYEDLTVALSEVNKSHSKITNLVSMSIEDRDNNLLSHIKDVQINLFVSDLTRLTNTIDVIINENDVGITKHNIETTTVAPTTTRKRKTVIKKTTDAPVTPTETVKNQTVSDDELLFTNDGQDIDDDTSISINLDDKVFSMDDFISKLPVVKKGGVNLISEPFSHIFKLEQTMIEQMFTGANIHDLIDVANIEKSYEHGINLTSYNKIKDLLPLPAIEITGKVSQVDKDNIPTKTTQLTEHFKALVDSIESGDKLYAFMTRNGVNKQILTSFQDIVNSTSI